MDTTHGQASRRTDVDKTAKIDGNKADHQLIGMVWLRCGTFTYSDEAKLASIVALSVAHEPIGPFLRARVFLKFISAAKALADKWGALQVTIHTTTGDQAGNADRLLKKRGARLIGGNYVL